MRFLSYKGRRWLLNYGAENEVYKKFFFLFHTIQRLLLKHMTQGVYDQFCIATKIVIYR